jgi:hypothetical protein
MAFINRSARLWFVEKQFSDTLFALYFKAGFTLWFVEKQFSDTLSP